MTNDQSPSARCALSLRVLLSDASYYAIRMIDIEMITDNYSESGEMLWPEFLICSSDKAAHRLCSYLNHLSYQESRKIWVDEEPYLEEDELRQRWLDDKIGVYEVIFVESLNTHPDIYRLSESLLTLNRINQQLVLV